MEAELRINFLGTPSTGAEADFTSATLPYTECELLGQATCTGYVCIGNLVLFPFF
jgi:hypothetical protein